MARCPHTLRRQRLATIEAKTALKSALKTASLCPSLRSRSDLLSVFFFPVARPLQGVGYLLGHVALVMLGEHAVGLERAGRLDHPFGDHTLALAEQIRQKALIGDRNGVLAIGHVETHRQIAAAHDAARLDQTAEPNAAAGCHVLFDDVAGR